jgi:hypothetical protein
MEGSEVCYFEHNFMWSTHELKITLSHSADPTKMAQELFAKAKEIAGDSYFPKLATGLAGAREKENRRFF